MNVMAGVLSIAALSISLAALTQPLVLAASAPGHKYFFYASQSGQKILDQGEGGGNPFASALIETLSRGDITLQMILAEPSKLTAVKSRGLQSADVASRIVPGNWKFRHEAVRKSRVALVVVFSDYARSRGAESLPGAKHDAARVGAALTDAGFATETIVDPTRGKLKGALRRFASRSMSSDMAAVYTTGHGVEVDGNVYLLPGDHPIAEGNDALEHKAVRLMSLAAAARGRRANFIFYGGCRDNPLK